MPFSLARYHELRRAQPLPPGAAAVGAEVRAREVTGSTMDDARAGAAAGAPVGTAYLAGHQTAGRGRQQRRWEGAEAAGLYVTFHLRPPPAAQPWAAVHGALAAAEALEATAGLRPLLKWPNDLLVGGRKLGGILAETARGADGATDVFLGIGLNLRPAAGMSAEVARLAISVAEAGAPPPPREELLAALAGALGAWTTRSPQETRTAWRAQLTTLGQTVRLAPPGAEDRAVSGVAVDVGERGELWLELPGGERRAFDAGEVTTLA